MLYHIKDYIPAERIAYGVPASAVGSPSERSYTVPLFCPLHVAIGQTYSFTTKRRFARGEYCFGELDTSQREVTS